MPAVPLSGCNVRISITTYGPESGRCSGWLSIASGAVFAQGEHADDERPADDDAATDSDDTAAAVRIAHFSPDAPNVDVLVDGEQVLADVSYGTISPYLELDPGTYTVAITAADDPETVAFEGEVDVGEGRYTVAAIGELGAETFRPEVLVDADPLPRTPRTSRRSSASRTSPPTPPRSTSTLTTRRSSRAFPSAMSPSTSRSPPGSTRSRSVLPARRPRSPPSTSRSSRGRSTPGTRSGTSNPPRG